MRLLLIFNCILFSFSAISQEETSDCKEIHSIESTVLNQKRNIWVGLPNNYDSARTYSVVYVLDAEERFDITYSLTKEFFQSQSAVPELIVVGIPHVDQIQRTLDLTFSDSKIDGSGKIDTVGYFNSNSTGNGITFLKYLENEVVPFVDSQYKTNGFNTLVGHSIGGYFCSYIIPIQKSFSAFQIYDPSIWYNDGDAIKQIKKNLNQTNKYNVFISKGTFFNGPREYVDHHLIMIDSLNSVLEGYSNIKLTYTSYEKDHVAMYFYSLIDGLSILFKDVEYGFISPLKKLTLQQYQDFYKTASDRLGGDFTPSMDGIRWVAYANYYQENWNEALKAYDLCYSFYENDIIVSKEIAKCYQMIGNSDKQKYYQEIIKELEQK